MKITLSNRVSQWSALPTASLHGKVLELQKSGEDIIDLTIGISDRQIPKAGEQAAVAAIVDNNVPYTAIGGDSELKRAIRQKLTSHNGITCDDENIIVSTGAKQAIFEALYTLTNSGDEWYSFNPTGPPIPKLRPC